MIVTHRTSKQQLPRSSPPISYPIPQEDPFSSYYSMTASSSSSQHSSRTHRPSVSNPMNWLSRTSSTPSTKSAPSPPSKSYHAQKPVRISEPKFKNSLETLNSQRSGALGGGAIVVRTPQEALTGAGVQMPHESDDMFDEDGSQYEAVKQRNNEDDLPSPPESPPLPSIPFARSTPYLPLKDSPTRPTRAPPAPPSSSAPNPRPVLKPTYSSQSLGSTLANFPPVPALPINITSSPPQAPFEPILISSVPNGVIDPSKVIISLETSTSTHRTTLSTLTSRTSYLSTYITSLLPKPIRNSDAASVYSHTSDPEPETPPPDSAFNSIFHRHLTASGVLPQASSSIHIFLDRPSAPYAHILTYLRAPVSTPEAPAALPRAVQLSSLSSARLESLLELRDEARYLDLEELYKLCSDEIRQRQASSIHSRERSSGSSGSILTMRTSRERYEYESTHRRESSRDSRSVLNENSTSTPSVISMPALSRPPVSIRPKQQNRYESLKSPPPAGWI